MRNTLLILLCFAAAALLACAKKQQPAADDTPAPLPIQTMPANSDTLTYLALGDSYTIGESVPQAGSFPYQLSSTLSQKGHPTTAPVIIARTGWTTDELITAIRQQNITRKFDFVTLLIGVNNQYRGYPVDNYRTEFVLLLNTAISYAGGKASHVFVVSIPDWGVTPFAAGQDRSRIGKEIDLYNSINLSESQKAGANYCNITDISRTATTNATLIAGDGLHPSGEMYRLWVGQLAPMVVGTLGK